MKYHRVLGSHRPQRSITVNGRNNGAKMNGTNAWSTEWIYEIYESTPTSLLAFISATIHIFLRIEHRSFLTKERGEREKKRRINIFDRVRNVTNLWRFALIVSLFGEEKITLWSLVVKRPRYYKSPCDNCAVPTVYPALCTSRKGGIRSSRATIQ